MQAEAAAYVGSLRPAAEASSYESEAGSAFTAVEGACLVAPALAAERAAGRGGSPSGRSSSSLSGSSLEAPTWMPEDSVTV